MNPRSKISRIPVGNTIVARWPITTNGQPLPIEGRILQLNIINPHGFTSPLDFSIIDTNVITFTFEGNRQSNRQLGIYMVELYERRLLSGQARIDRDAFELVRHSRESFRPVPSPSGLQLSVPLDLESSDIGALTGSPYIQDGYWYIDGRNLGVQAEGKTPHIVEGYWYIGDQPTGQPAFLIPTFDPTTGKIRYEIF